MVATKARQQEQEEEQELELELELICRSHNHTLASGQGLQAVAMPIMGPIPAPIQGEAIHIKMQAPTPRCRILNMHNKIISNSGQAIMQACNRMVPRGLKTWMSVLLRELNRQLKPRSCHTINLHLLALNLDGISKSHRMLMLIMLRYAMLIC
jgi:hypothetical protein